MQRFFNFSSKIDGCSLKRIGQPPFEFQFGLRCIGASNSAKSSDEILLLSRVDRYTTEAVMCVL